MEPLSLETFDPVYAREPYLTTPRSLEACRFHGVNPEELVEIPFREFQRAYPDDPEMALRRFERVDSARRIMLESVYHKWQELCWEEEHSKGRRKGKGKGGLDTVIQPENGQHMTVLEMQAEQFRRVEKQQWKSLRNKLFMEMKKAAHDQKAKSIIEKQDNIGDTAARRRKEMELERERKLRADLEEAEEKEKEAQREIRRQQQLAMQEAKAKVARDEQNRRKEKRAQLRREQERLAREEYRNSQKLENFHRRQAEANERSRQLEKQEKELELRMKKERMKKEEQDKQRKLRTMNRLQGAKEELERQAQEKLRKVTKSIEDFDAKVDKLREDKRAKWQHDKKLNSGKSQRHLESVRATNRAKTEEKINSTMSDLEKRNELAQHVLSENEEQRNRRRAIKEVRQQSFELAAIRRKKAMDYRKEKLEESIRAKDERYKTIKEGEKTLKRMTDSMAEVISKTKMELTSEMNRLNSKDILTTDNVVAKVHEHNDTVLFPRLRSRFSHMPLPDDDPPTEERLAAATTTSKSADFGSTAVSESDVKNSSKDAPATLASSLPLPSSRSPSKARPFTTGGMNRKGSPGSGSFSLRPKSPTPAIGLKVLSRSRINDTLDNMKMTLEERNAVKQGEGSPSSTQKTRTPVKKSEKKRGSSAGSRRKQDSWVSESSEGPPAVESTPSPATATAPSGSFKRKSTPFPDELKPREGPRSRDLHASEETFDELEEVEADESEEDDADDIIARIEGSSSKRPKSKQQKQKQTRRPPTPEGEFRAEYSRDHPLAGGKGRYAEESAQGKQRVLPGRPRHHRPKRLVEVMSKQEQKKHALQNQLEELRKHQNKALLEVLEDERVAEEGRMEMSRGVTDTKERNRLELVFAEERKRASERIIAMTKEHEQKK